MKNRLWIILAAGLVTLGACAMQPSINDLALEIDAEIEQLAFDYKLIFVRQAGTMLAANMQKIASYFNPRSTAKKETGSQERMISVYAPISTEAKQKELLAKIDAIFTSLEKKYANVHIQRSSQSSAGNVAIQLATYKNPSYQSGVQTFVAQPEEYIVFYDTGKKIQRSGKFNIFASKNGSAPATLHN